MGVTSGVVSGAISQTNDHDGAGVSLAKLDGAGVPSFVEAAPEAVAVATVEADSVHSIPDDVAHVEAALEAVTAAHVEADSVPSIPDEVAPVETAPEAVTAAPVEADSVPSIPDDVAPVETDSVPSIPDDVTECLDDAPGRVFRWCNISQSPAFPLL